MSTPVNIKEARITTFRKEISETLTYQDAVIGYFEGEVTEIKGRNNQDGSQDLTYTVKPILISLKKKDSTGVKQISQGYEVKEKSESQRTRALAYVVSQETGENSEDLYIKAQEVARDWLNQHRLEQTII